MASTTDWQDDDKSTFVDPEDAFGEIILCSVNPLPRKAPPNIHGRQPSEQIFDLKYSPDGRLLCVCTGDNVIDVYKHAVSASQHFDLNLPALDHALLILQPHKTGCRLSRPRLKA
eukprot:1442882-Rhodomonas_salina.4